MKKEEIDYIINLVVDKKPTHNILKATHQIGQLKSILSIIMSMNRSNAIDNYFRSIK